MEDGFYHIGDMGVLCRHECELFSCIHRSKLRGRYASLIDILYAFVCGWKGLTYLYFGCSMHLLFHPVRQAEPEILSGV